jgi:hypothetical protein
MTVIPTSIQSGASYLSGPVPDPQRTPVTRADLYPVRRSTRTVEPTGEISNLKFPTDLGKYYFKMEIHNYNRQISYWGTKAGATVDFEGAILLPLPEQLVDINAVDFSPTPTFPVDSLLNSAAGIVGQVAGGLLGRNRASAGIISGLTSGALSGGITLLEAQAGIAPNQFLTVMLKGPQYKRHNFTWKLYPRNADEAKKIKDIVDTIKNYMRPGIAGNGLFFSFPKVFVLKFSDNLKLYQFKPAAIESMSVNYTPSGSPTLHNDGYTDGVELSIHFIELEYWREDSNDFMNSEIISGISGAINSVLGFGDTSVE